VRIGQVLEALAHLRRGERRTATRTSVVNLVMVADDADEAERACDAMHQLETGHPGRTLVLVRDPYTTGPGLDAEVRLHGAAAGGRGVWSDEVRLWVRGALDAHLHSLVEPLTLPDVPVAVWFLARAPQPADPVLSAADVVIVDTKEAADQDAFGLLVPLAARHQVLDLSWIRLGPWRALLANLFEVPPFRPFLDGVRSVTVQGKPGPRRLIAGWLASRLGLGPSALHLADARHLLVEMRCDHHGVTATFTVDRPPGERLVRSRAAVPSMPPYEDRLILPDDALPWSLSKALTCLEPHVSYGPALEAAVSFA
jgi:glucose-6-phosphate dehydrogenase assembly protein OpcA